jgi:hypothetical protein
MGRQNAVIDEYVDARSWRQRGQPLEQGEEFEAQMGRRLASWSLEHHEHRTVGPQREAVLRDGRAQQVATELLEPVPVLARHRDPACRSQPSHRACNGRDDSAHGASGSPPRRSTRAPARGPSASRPWTAALASPASARDSAASGSAASASAVRPWRTSSRPMRRAIATTNRAMSASAGGGRRWKRNVPSALDAKTPSSASTWKCTFNSKPLAKRCTTLTVPLRPLAIPARRTRQRYRPCNRARNAAFHDRGPDAGGGATS